MYELYESEKDLAGNLHPNRITDPNVINSVHYINISGRSVLPDRFQRDFGPLIKEIIDWKWSYSAAV